MQPGADGVGEGLATVCRAGVRGQVPGGAVAPRPSRRPFPGSSLCPPVPSCGGPVSSHVPVVLAFVPGTHLGCLSRGGLLPCPSLGHSGHPAARGQRLSKRRRDQDPGREQGLA